MPMVKATRSTRNWLSRRQATSPSRQPIRSLATRGLPRSGFAGTSHNRHAQVSFGRRLDMSRFAQTEAPARCLIQRMISASRTALLVSGQEPVAIFPNNTGRSKRATPGSLIAIFDTREQAETAVCELQKARIDMSTISIAAKDTQLDERPWGFYNATDRIRRWGKFGAIGGALWGLLFDSTLFVMPGIDPVLVSGPLVSWIVAVLEGAMVFGGLSALSAGLVITGIPKKAALEYETAIKLDKFLLVVHGTPTAIANAREAFQGTSCSYTVHGERIYAKSA